MYRRFRKKSKQKADSGSQTFQQRVQKMDGQYVDQLKSVPIYDQLSLNQKIIEELFDFCSDFVIRSFEIEKGRRALAIFVDGLIETGEVNDALEALMIFEGGTRPVDELLMKSVPVSQTTEVDNYKDLLLGVLSGDTGVLVDGNDKAALLGLRGAKGRSVAEPETESVVRGPREGYIENLRANTAMLRRKIKSPRLKMKAMIVGRESNTNLVLAYLEGVAAPETVEEVEKRIEKIEIDAILESGYIEELIQDSTYSPFPQVQYTERPDTTAGALLEGRIAIMIDGTPFALIVPTTFWQLMQANEDYYERFQMATLIRWLRYFFLIVALTTPALYIAITTFHQQMLPTTLLLSLAAARETIPFPALVEALIMEVAFEALREAGVRLPKTVGQAVSILGALVVGQAAVQAGIVSAPMVMIVSITGIASFTIPRYNAAIAFRMLRFPLMFLASIFGMYGIVIGNMLIIGHMAKLRSFGVPYLSPTGPLSLGDAKDVLIRAPWWAMGDRPSFLDVEDKHRIGEQMKDELVAQGGQSGKQIKHETSGPSEEQGSKGEGRA
jgi:spore germination protein